MTLIRRSLAALAAALMLGGPALTATPQTMTGAWVKVASAGSGTCVTVSTTDGTSATQIETSSGTPAPTDQGRALNFYNPVSGYITSDLWAKGPAGSTLAVDVGFCGGSGAVAGGGGSGPTLQTLALSPTVATAGSPYTGTISGQTAGSTVTASSSDSTPLSVSNGQVTGTFAAAGQPVITLNEALGGATGSPKSSQATVTVSASGPDLTNPANTELLHNL